MSTILNFLYLSLTMAFSSSFTLSIISIAQLSVIIFTFQRCLLRMLAFKSPHPRSVHKGVYTHWYSHAKCSPEETSHLSVSGPWLWAWSRSIDWLLVSTVWLWAIWLHLPDWNLVLLVVSKLWSVWRVHWLVVSSLWGMVVWLVSMLWVSVLWVGWLSVLWLFNLGWSSTSSGSLLLGDLVSLALSVHVEHLNSWDLSLNDLGGAKNFISKSLEVVCGSLVDWLSRWGLS